MSSRLLIVLLISVTSTILLLIKLTTNTNILPQTVRQTRHTLQKNIAGWNFMHSRDANTHSLSNLQCDAAFPYLFDRIEFDARKRAQTPVQSEELSIPGGRCMLRVLIHEGELRVTDLGDPLECHVPNGRERILATLSLIQRAVVSSSEPIPNIEFPISYDDIPRRSTSGITWGFAKREEDENVWLMPDYGYWSSWTAGLSSFSSVKHQIDIVDEVNPWIRKISKAVWRGSTHHNTQIRSTLVEKANNTAWGDAQVVTLGEDERHFMSLEDQCRYQFLINAESVSFSGSFKYLLLCKSVNIAHRMRYSEFFTHLLQPYGPDQNFIEVRRDWSDLDGILAYFLKRPHEAEVIAQRSHEIFNRRYLTPAAISCYLRKMMQAWATIQAFEPELYFVNGTTGLKEVRGLPFEALTVSVSKHEPSKEE